MRRLFTWVLIALLLLTSVAFAENVSAAKVTAVNGRDAVRTTSEVFLAIPSEGQQMLVSIPLVGGTPICVDRADSISDLIPYAGGVAYLKVDGENAYIMHCAGNSTETVYPLTGKDVKKLSMRDGSFYVLIGELLHTVDPNAQTCLKLSGAQMLDYVIDADCAYYIAGGDRLEYSAQLEGDETVTTQAGCIYKLDLASGETSMLLKSGSTDLKLMGDALYFHNLADAYAVRSADKVELVGRVYSLDVPSKTLESACTEPDSGFWTTDKGLVVWHGGALNLNTEAGKLAIYTPENGATVASDGVYLYAWESAGRTLTQISTLGDSKILYAGDLTQVPTPAQLQAEVTPTVEPTATDAPQNDQATSASDAWYQEFVENTERVNGGEKPLSLGSTDAKPTPIPAQSTTDFPAEYAASEGKSAASSTTPKKSTTSSASTYSVSAKYVTVTGGNVNMRANPTTSAKIIRTIPNGTVMKCTGKGATAANGGKWYQVDYLGDTGWVSMQYAKKSSAPSSSYTGPETKVSGSEVTVINGDVTLRKNPNKTSTSLGAIAKGTTVDFLGKQSIDSRGVKWYKVSYDGKTGWISSKYSKIGGSGSGGGSSSGTRVKIVGGDVTIRSSANKTSSKVGYIKEGDTAEYLGDSKKDSRGVKWYHITYKGKTGWVSSKFSKLQ